LADSLFVGTQVGDPVDLVRRQRGVVSEHHVGIPPPPARKVAEQRREREAAYNTVSTFAERYLKERSLRPTTGHNYRRLLVGRINPYFGEMPLKDVTLSEIKAWRASLDPKTEASNAAAYRLLRSLLSTPGWRCRTSCLPGGPPHCTTAALRRGKDPGPGSVSDWGSARGAPFGIGTPNDTTRVGIVSKTAAQPRIRSDRCLRVAAVFSSIEVTGC